MPNAILLGKYALHPKTYPWNSHYHLDNKYLLLSNIHPHPKLFPPRRGNRIPIHPPRT